MTDLLFQDDAYLKSATATVTQVTDEGGIVLDATIFYPQGGGQPGDSGRLTWDGGACDIASTVKAEGGVGAILVPAMPAPLPPEGARVEMALNWVRRHRFMRMHTALHLLSVVVPLPVTGGQIGADKSRLDFDMPEVIHDRDFVQARLTQLIDADSPVTAIWADPSVLDDTPGLVKTRGAAPPTGGGRLRLVRIGPEDAPVDLQPCGGTHVASTAEIGRVRVGKIENKGRSNRRISITLDG